MNLVVNADDFGRNAKVNKAIAEAFKLGYINQTTLMVNMPCCDTAVELARCNGFVDNIGLHLNFTEGEPMTRPIKRCRECCDENGVFRTKSFAMGWMPLERSTADAVAFEARAQIEKYLSLGGALLHCDGHHHIHNRLPIAYIVLPILKEYGFRSVRNRYTSLAMFPRGAEQKARNYIFGQLVKKYGFSTTELFGGWCKATIEALSRFESAEIMVHPNYDAVGRLVDVQDWKFGDGPELSKLRDVVNED